jgi:hypothetical protein
VREVVLEVPLVSAAQGSPASPVVPLVPSPPSDPSELDPSAADGPSPAAPSLEPPPPVLPPEPLAPVVPPPPHDTPDTTAADEATSVAKAKSEKPERFLGDMSVNTAALVATGKRVISLEVQDGGRIATSRSRGLQAPVAVETIVLMRLGALLLVGAIFATDGFARAQQEPTKLAIIDPRSVRAVQGAVVHVEASDPRAHVQELTRYSEWINVCDVPCDQPLDPTFDYRVAGRGLRATAKFRVPPQGQLLLRADMKPVRNIVLGATFASVGGLFLVSGLIEVTVGMLERANASTEQDPDLAQRDRDAGYVLNLVGVVSAIAGAVMLVPGFIFLESGTKSTLGTVVHSALRRSNLRIIPGGLAF